MSAAVAEANNKAQEAEAALKAAQDKVSRANNVCTPLWSADSTPFCNLFLSPSYQ
jgi:hypothetical protein